MGTKVYLFARPFGKMSGSVSSCGASNLRGLRCSFSGNWSKVASEPRDTAARPNLGGGLMESNQALE
ncbi:Uncharacterised protein [Mycobacterium tuberculosis]|nr:Uncharacterised protein [Mycobacterium tuberculosis]